MPRFENTWPEDEAYSLLVLEKERRENDWTEEELVDCRVKDVFHMKKVFGREEDGADLFTRFEARLAQGLED